MANTFGYCKKCQIYGEPPRFIDVNTEHSVIICPKCGTRMTPKQAMTNYDNFFEGLYKEAEILLFRARNYQGAYKAFAKIIDYRPDDVIARYGRILSLVYLSTLRHTYFNEALLMFSEERKKYLRDKRYRLQYFTFIRESNKAVDKYRILLKKRLVYKTKDGKEYFYDKDCVSLYFHRILQIKKFKEMFLEECNFLKTKLEDDSFDSLMNFLEVEIKELDNILKTKVVDLEGYKHTFNRVSDDDIPIIGRSDVKDLKVPTKVKRRALVEKKGVAKGINDQIYYGTKAIYTLSKIAVPIFFVCSTIAIAFYILSAVFKNAASLFQIVATVSLSIGAVGILLHGVWNILCRLSNNYKLYKRGLFLKKNKK